jgi:hypothetical protein
LRSPDEVPKDTTYEPRSFLAPYTPKVPFRLLLYLFLDTPNLNMGPQRWYRCKIPSMALHLTLVVAMAKYTPVASNSRPAYSGSPNSELGRFENRAVGKLVVGVATRSQLNKPPGMPTMVTDSMAQDEPCIIWV